MEENTFSRTSPLRKAVTRSPNKKIQEKSHQKTTEGFHPDPVGSDEDKQEKDDQTLQSDTKNQEEENYIQFAPLNFEKKRIQIFDGQVSSVPLEKYKIIITPEVSMNEITIPYEFNKSVLANLYELFPQMEKKYQDEQKEIYLVNQSPGCSVFRILNVELPEHVSVAILVLPKPFNPQVISIMKNTIKSKDSSTIPVHCGLCNEYISQGDIQLRRMSKTRVKNEKRRSKSIYTCECCQYFDENKTTVKTHLADHILSKEFFCTNCDFKGKRESVNETTEKSENINVEEMVMVEPLSSKSISVCCNQCQTYLCGINALIDKLLIGKVVQNKETYECGICGKFIPSNKPQAQQHIFDHVVRSYIFCSDCHLCSQYKLEPGDDIPVNRVSNKSSLTLQVRCSSCERVFSYSSALVGSWENYVDTSPYSDKQKNRKFSLQCKFCKKSYNGCPDLAKLHVLLHFREIEVNCLACRKMHETKILPLVE